jgi:hypothetical protein
VDLLLWFIETILFTQDESSCVFNNSCLKDILDFMEKVIDKFADMDSADPDEIRQILTDFAEAIQPQWIRVEDELPKENEKVLTISIENNHFIFDIAIIECHGKHFSWHQLFSPQQLINVIAWQPLPQPPEDV